MTVVAYKYRDKTDTLIEKKQEKFEKEAKGFIDQFLYETGVESDLYDTEVILGEIYITIEEMTGLVVKNKGNNWSKSKIYKSNKIELNERRDGAMDFERKKTESGLQALRSNREKVCSKFNEQVITNNDRNTLSMNDVRQLLNSRLKGKGLTISQQVLDERNEARA